MSYEIRKKVTDIFAKLSALNQEVSRLQQECKHEIVNGVHYFKIL